MSSDQRPESAVGLCAGASPVSACVIFIGRSGRFDCGLPSKRPRSSKRSTAVYRGPLSTTRSTVHRKFRSLPRSTLVDSGHFTPLWVLPQRSSGGDLERHLFYGAPPSPWAVSLALVPGGREPPGAPPPSTRGGRSCGVGGGTRGATAPRCAPPLLGWSDRAFSDGCSGRCYSCYKVLR